MDGVCAHALLRAYHTPLPLPFVQVPAFAHTFTPAFPHLPHPFWFVPAALPRSGSFALRSLPHLPTPLQVWFQFATVCLFPARLPTLCLYLPYPFVYGSSFRTAHAFAFTHTFSFYFTRGLYPHLYRARLRFTFTHAHALYIYLLPFTFTGSFYPFPAHPSPLLPAPPLPVPCLPQLPRSCCLPHLPPTPVPHAPPAQVPQFCPSSQPFISFYLPSSPTPVLPSSS